MDELLKPVQTNWIISEVKEDGNEGRAGSEISPSVSSAGEALEILKSQPNQSSLTHVLTFIDPKHGRKDGLNIKAPTPLSSQLINVLVATIIPDFWSILQEDGLHQQRDVLLRCLASVSGLGAILAQMRSLISASKPEKGKVDRRDISQRLSNLLAVLMQLLGNESFTWTIWSDIALLGKSFAQKSVLWREYISVVGTSRLVSTAAEAEDIIKESELDGESARWICSGSQYAQWLGWNAGRMAVALEESDLEGWKSLAGLVGKSLSLGFTDSLVRQLYYDLLMKDKHSLSKFQSLLKQLPQHQQRSILYTLCRIISRSLPHSNQSLHSPEAKESKNKAISGFAGLIAGIIAGNAQFSEDLTAYLLGSAGSGAGEPVGIRRVIVTALSSDEDALETLLDKAMQHFGDKLYIKHTPTLYQEALAQVLLLVAGYIHVANPMHLFTMARSSIHINSISNRLAASSPRARFLGMIVGVSISELVDKPDKQMKFGIEELESDEAKWYKSLVRTNDKIGTLDDLKSSFSQPQSSTPSFLNQTVSQSRETITPSTSKPTSSKPTQKPRAPKQAPKEAPIVDSKKRAGIIQVLSSSATDSEDDDDDLIPYEKPDSDPEDSDDDPTLVQRKKPSAPVYIRDLISGLRDRDNYDRQRISLSSASALIRRKAGFGTELSEHSEELASLLIGLGDKFSIEHFQEWRLQAMIALLVAQPLEMGQWFSRTFFEGDYSIGQRISILTTLGMSAREIAGYKEDAHLTQSLDSKVTPNSNSPFTNTSKPFPSKHLPQRLHDIYSSDPPAASSSSPPKQRLQQQSQPVDLLTSQLEQSMIKPMAATAADSLSGPNALKVRTFSSRMAVEQRRGKPLPNQLAKVVAAGFFLPLTGLWWAQMNAYNSSSSSFASLSLATPSLSLNSGSLGRSSSSSNNSNNIYTSPILLPYYLKTLALILHAAGPSNPALPQMTSELWTLLLSLRFRSLHTQPHASSFTLGSAMGATSSGQNGQYDIPILEALLFAFLTLLDINAETEGAARRIAEEYARELLETQEWAEQVFSMTRGGGSGQGQEEDKVRMLAASVLLRTRDIVERYQRLLMGDMLDF